MRPSAMSEPSCWSPPSGPDLSSVIWSSGCGSVCGSCSPPVVAQRPLDHLARRPGAHQMVCAQFRTIPFDPFGQVAFHVVVGYQSQHFRLPIHNRHDVLFLFRKNSTIRRKTDSGAVPEGKKIPTPARVGKVSPAGSGPDAADQASAGASSEASSGAVLNSVKPARTRMLYHEKHFFMSETWTRSRSYSGSTSAK